MASIFSEKPVRELLEAVLSLARRRKKRVYLVGGILRDELVRRRKLNPDFDFALDGGAIVFARQLAALLKAGFVALDETHGIGRVVKKSAGVMYTFDFSDFKGKDLEEDLRHRDFTVNAMAAPLEQVMERGAALRPLLVDPLDGRGDIARKVVRLAGPSAFDDDPLRVMRAFSTAAILGFTVEKNTLRCAKKKRAGLFTAAGERLRDELFKIFAAAKSRQSVELLDRYGVLEVALPEIGPMKRMRGAARYRLDVWGHTLETLEKLERAGSHFMRLGQVREYLGRELSSGRSRWQLLKLAVLVHDIGKPSTFRVSGGKLRFHGHDREGAYIAVGIARRLKLAREEERFLRQVVAMHLRPGFLATAPRVTAKAEYRFFRDAGIEAGSILILALADLRATRGYLPVEKSRAGHERLIKRLLRSYFQRAQCPPPKRLVTGDDLVKLGLVPSPLFGRILRRLDELQAEKTITTKAEGSQFALRMARADCKAKKER